MAMIIQHSGHDSPANTYGQELQPPPERVKPPKRLAIRGKVFRAAWLVAEGVRSDRQIITDLGISMVMLHKWERHPDFMAKVEEFRAEINRAVLSHGVAVKENRIRGMQERLDRMKALIAARAESGEARVARGIGDPGEETGLLAETGAGKVTVMAFDTGLMKEIRELERQVAQELGQFERKVDVTSGGQTIAFTIPMSDVPDTVGTQEILEPQTVKATVIESGDDWAKRMLDDGQ